jgi:hypothetical protein
MPHFGHRPGLSDTTSGCMGQVYLAAAGFGAAADMAGPGAEATVGVSDWADFWHAVASMSAAVSMPIRTT